jgi:predicted small integral membrane protein
MTRNLKSVLALFVALFCLMYALQNVVNLQSAFAFVQLVVGMSGHEAYPNHFGPAFASPAIVWLLLWIIITAEALAGLLAAKGALDMWRARNAGADSFNAAKKYGILGAGLAVIIWFGFFSAIGGAYFQMWQTQAGAQALQGAFQYSMLNGLILIFLSMRDE